MYLDDCRLKGVVNLVLRDKDGKVKQHKTIRNKVTRAGIAHIIGRMIDDGQDRNGLHKMPRMMSHMAIGIGAAARSAPNRYNAKDLDSLPTNIPGLTDSSGAATATSRKRAAIPATYDKMLQDERGNRIQLMKDTTKTGEYATLQNVDLAGATDSNSAAIAMHASSGTASQLIFETGSDSGNTLKRLRVGLQVSAIGTTSGSLTDLTSGGTVAGPKITKIESGVAGSAAASSATTITLSASLGANAPGASVTQLYLDIDYVDQVALTTYSTNTLMPNHPTFTNVQSEFQPNGTDNLGPFGAAAARGKTFSGTSPYKEDGKGLLGITRGQIGAFYEREIEYNIKLKYTDANGLPITSGFTGATAVSTVVDEAGFAVLDGNAAADSTAVARFPFIGAEEDKPSGTAAVQPSTTAGQNTATTRGTEFVQFGTAVDGIFQGALIGSSIVANGRNTLPEGYPEEENDYGQIGGLTVTNPSSGQAMAEYNTGSGKAFVAYNPSASYAPNAVAGAKKNGDRIVYVATFKENNPRPETDYDQLHGTSTGVTRAPFNRIYPITEAGIFNKHIKDLGIFDVGNRSYMTTGATDATVSELAHIDTRGGGPANNATVPTSGTALTLVAGAGTNGHTNIAPVEGVLTSQGQSITAHGYGFTQGPLTQTMLCRTTFDPVNKATADTLQITWSVQLQDNTPSGI